MARSFFGQEISSVLLLEICNEEESDFLSTKLTVQQLDPANIFLVHTCCFHCNHSMHTAAFNGQQSPCCLVVTVNTVH